MSNSMWKCGVFWILLGNISATVRLYKTPKRPCEIKKNSLFMTVKYGASRVGHLYAIWTLPRGEGTPAWKKKWNFCRKPIWTCLTLYLSLWTGLHQHPASLRCYFTSKIEKIVLSKTRRQNDFYLRVWEDMGSFIIMVWIKLPIDLEF